MVKSKFRLLFLSDQRKSWEHELASVFGCIALLMLPFALTGFQDLRELNTYEPYDACTLS